MSDIDNLVAVERHVDFLELETDAIDETGKVVTVTGLTLTGDTISGTPTAEGGFNFTITAGYSSVISRYVEVGSGFTLEVGADSDLEVL